MSGNTENHAFSVGGSWRNRVGQLGDGLLIRLSARNPIIGLKEVYEKLRIPLSNDAATALSRDFRVVRHSTPESAATVSVNPRHSSETVAEPP